LNTHFRIKDLGNLKYFLGIKVSWIQNKYCHFTTKVYFRNFEGLWFSRCQAGKFSNKADLKLSESGDLLKNPSQYRWLVGHLIYLTITHPNVTYSVHILSKFMHAPRKPHMEVVLRVMHYLKSIPGQGLFFPTQNNLSLRAFSDSDWGGCPTSWRSTTDYYIFLGSALIS
jgi:hypothetical protein